MSYTENAAKELFEYLPIQTKKSDFEDFWEQTIQKAKSVPLRPEMKQFAYPSPYVKVYDITYCGFDETRIHGWYIVPTFAGKEKYPCLINYHGWTGSRGQPSDFMMWVMQGLAVLSVDCRDQVGETGTVAGYSHGGSFSVIAKGLLDKNEYYYRAVYMDCLKAIDFAGTCTEVDMDRIIVHGGSQGGGLGMAVCSLDSRPWMALVDVPSFSNLEKRVESSAGGFTSVTDYLKRYPDRVEQVFDTLSYFDIMNMADRVQCRVFASVGLMDTICPPKLYFASYNRIKSEKHIKIYPFNGHEGGQSLHNQEKLKYLADSLNSI